MSDKEDYETRGEKKVSRSRSPEVKRRSRSRSRSGSSRRSDSRSRSRSASRGRSRDRKYRSRSRSKGRYRSRSGSRRRRSNSRSKSPMSNRRRHVGDREDPSENCCLGVFGLSLYTTEREIKEVFGRYGPLDNINVVHDHQTGRSRGFAFVTYESVEDAKEAKEKTTGIELDGRRIRVDFSITRRPHTPTPGIYMGKPTRPVRKDYFGYYGRRTPSPEYRRRSPSPYRSRRYSRSRSRSPRDYRK